MAANSYQPGLSLPTPQPSNAGNINPNQAFQGDQGASELLGQLNRAQWEDWKQRFRPYTDALANAAQGNGNRAARNARDAMGLAFDANDEALSRRRDRMGVSTSQRQANAENRRQNVQQAASKVSAGNQARVSDQDRRNAILAGGMGLSNIPDEVLNQ